MSGIIDDMLPTIDSILGIRDDLGVALKTVYFVTRTWSGAEPGDGVATDVRVRMLPTPRVQEFKHSARIVEGGTIHAGDVLLKMVSKNAYPTEDLLDGSTSSESIQKFFEVGGVLYTVVSVREKHLVWNILLRQQSVTGA